ncbi:VOC family protein [Bdellovibrio sp. HCB2-146]|uniref:VOC family protein n=1 Tax=Bdellovibrio sp. HCB2-146 TaxID=3394362 RepID=UPI0039BC25B4
MILVEGRNPVGWFEIPVTDVMRARKFYESSFDVKMNLMEGQGAKMALFPMHDGAEGAAGALVQASGYKPVYDGPMIYFSVKSIDEALSKIQQAGGKVMKDKTDIGEHGMYAIIQDGEGNRIGLHANKNKN